MTPTPLPGYEATYMSLKTIDGRTRTVPNRDGIALVLDKLAGRLKCGPAQTSTRVGGSIVEAETKLRVLRLILKTCAPSQSGNSSTAMNGSKTYL